MKFFMLIVLCLTLNLPVSAMAESATSASAENPASLPSPQKEDMKKEETHPAQNLLMEKIWRCKNTSDNFARLNCYDQLFHNIQDPALNGNSEKGNSAPESIAEPESPNTPWKLSIDTDEMDDSKQVFISNRAVKPFYNSFGTAEYPVLILRCTNNKTEAYIAWDTYLGMDSSNVTIRLDKEKAFSASWGHSTDNQATFIPSPIKFIKGLFGHNTMLVQIQPYNEAPHIAVFDITGLEEAIKPLQECCGWK